MRIIRFSGYLILGLILLFGPLYGAGRIILPDWIKGQMVSALPSGTKLSIGEMFSTAKMGVLYKNLVFERADGSLNISFNDLLIEPNLSLSKPAEISIGKGLVKSGENNIFIKDFKASVILGKADASKLSLFGKIKEIEGEAKTVLSNIEFLIQGLTSFEKSVTANAGELSLKLLVPEGQVSVDLASIDLKGSLGNTVNTTISAKKAKVDMSALGSGNANRILHGQNVSMDLSLREGEHWFLPLKFSAEN